MTKRKLIKNVENLQLALQQQQKLMETFGTQMDDVTITVKKALDLLDELIISLKIDGYARSIAINKIVRIENILKEDFPVALLEAKIVCFDGRPEELLTAFQKIKNQAQKFFKECEERNKNQTTRTVK